MIREVVVIDEMIMLDRLHQMIREYGSQAALAKELCVSDVYISRVKLLKKLPSKRLLGLMKIKLVKKVTYRYEKLT